MCIKLTKQVITEYRERLQNIQIINDTIRKRYLELFNDAVKNRDRAKVFQVIAFVEEWSSRVVT